MPPDTGPTIIKDKDMKIKNIASALSILAGACAALTACNDSDYLIYDTSECGIYFTKDTLKYSFSVTPTETRTYTYNIPVKIMGAVSDKEREIGFEVITDTTTAVEGVQYTIGKAVIYPDSITGNIPVVILRDGLEGTYDTGYTSYTLGLRLIENDNFAPTLSSKEHVRVLTFDNAVDMPDWFDYKGDKVWDKDYLGEWHPLKLIKMVEYFHEIANILPETYVKIVEAYGENLESIPYGDPYQYRTIFNKYIYSPMYEYFSNPDNREEILSQYPDFPFDFPNPFKK